MEERNLFSVKALGEGLLTLWLTGGGECGAVNHLAVPSGLLEVKKSLYKGLAKDAKKFCG